jgi:Caspase domain/WD domain, G-beta repeat
LIAGPLLVRLDIIFRVGAEVVHDRSETFFCSGLCRLEPCQKIAGWLVFQFRIIGTRDLKVLQPALRILILLLSFFGLIGTSQAKRVALVIGIENYTHLQPLANPLRDARATAALLSKNGFVVRTLFDVDHKSFETGLVEFKKLAQDAEEAIVLYSGHGMTVVKNRQLVNALSSTDSTLDCKTRTAKRMVSMKQVMATIAKVPKQVLLFDSCRNDAILDCEETPLTEAMSGFQAISTTEIRAVQGPARNLIKRGFKHLKDAARPATAPSILIGYSTGLGQTALDGPVGGNSPFIKVLLDELTTSPTTTFRNVLEATSKRVTVAVGQRPWVVTDGGEPVMCLAGGNCVKDAEEREQRLLEQSRSLAALSGQRLQLGDVGQAIALARRALPTNFSRPDRPITAAAIQSLYNAYSATAKEHLVRTLRGHSDSILGGVQLNDGRLLTWSRDKTARLWDSDGSPGPILKGHTGTVSGARQLIDGRLVTWSSDKTARLWAADGRPGPILEGHSSPVTGLLELRDGSLLTWGGYNFSGSDNTARLWSVDGRPTAVLKGHEEPIRGALQLNNDRLLTWGLDGTARIWEFDGSSGQILAKRVDGVYALRNGHFLTWGGRFAHNDNTARVWTPEGRPIATLNGHTKPVEGALQLRDGRLLTWSSDWIARIWETDWTLGPTLNSCCGSGVVQLRNGKLIAWSGKQAQIWTTQGNPGQILSGHTNKMDGILQLKDGGLVSWSWDKTARLWTSDGNPGPILKGHVGPVSGALQLHDGSLMTWGGTLTTPDKICRIWTAEGMHPMVVKGHKDQIIGTLRLKDGRLLTWSADNTARIWSAEGRPGPVLTGHSDSVWGAKQLSDGQLLTFSRDKTARLWSADGTAGPILRGHTESIWGSFQLKDGRLLTWSGDKTARLWNANGSPGPTLMGHSKEVLGAIQLQSGDLLTWSNDKTARLWAADGSASSAVLEHAAAVFGALQLKDGRLLTWSSNEIRLWTATGSPGRTLQGHTELVSGALQLTDGRILTWSWDKTARLWDRDGSPESVLKGHTGPVYGAVQLRDGRLLTWAGGPGSEDGRLTSGPSDDKTARLWMPNGKQGPVLTGHTAPVYGALQLSDGRLFTWSGGENDKTARIWTAEGVSGPILKGHTSRLAGALQIDDGRLLTWSEDGTARIWPLDEHLLQWASRYIADKDPLPAAVSCNYGLDTNKNCGVTLRANNR